MVKFNFNNISVDESFDNLFVFKLFNVFLVLYIGNCVFNVFLLFMVIFGNIVIVVFF